MMFAHTKYIQLGIRGESSKIREELEELEDSRGVVHAVLELTDIVEATGQYARHKCRCPLFVIVALVYVRSVYKPARNWILDSLGWPKGSYFPKQGDEENERKRLSV